MTNPFEKPPQPVEEVTEDEEKKEIKEKSVEEEETEVEEKTEKVLLSEEQVETRYEQRNMALEDLIGKIESGLSVKVAFVSEGRKVVFGSDTGLREFPAELKALGREILDKKAEIEKDYQAELKMARELKEKQEREDVEKKMPGLGERFKGI